MGLQVEISIAGSMIQFRNKLGSKSSVVHGTQASRKNLNDQKFTIHLKFLPSSHGGLWKSFFLFSTVP
jgi:hypothetical protein